MGALRVEHGVWRGRAKDASRIAAGRQDNARTVARRRYAVGVACGSGSGAAPSTTSASSAKPPTLRFENPIATSTTRSATPAIVQRAGLLSRRLITAGRISNDTRFMTLISGFSAGPAGSLNGAPPVSPVTAALWG